MKTYIIIEKDVEAVRCIKTIVDQFKNMIFSGNAKDQNEALHLIFKMAPDIVFFGFDDVVDHLSEFLYDVAKHSKKDPVFIALSSSKDLAYEVCIYDFILCTCPELYIHVNV